MNLPEKTGEFISLGEFISQYFFGKLDGKLEKIFKKKEKNMKFFFYFSKFEMAVKF